MLLVYYTIISVSNLECTVQYKNLLNFSTGSNVLQEMIIIICLPQYIKQIPCLFLCLMYPCVHRCILYTDCIVQSSIYIFFSVLNNLLSYYSVILQSCF